MNNVLSKEEFKKKCIDYLAEKKKEKEREFYAFAKYSKYRRDKRKGG